MEAAALGEEDWLLSHSKLAQLNSYVTGDRPQLLSTLQIYLDLTEVKLWHSVDIKYSETLRMAFLTAQQSKDDVCRCILPLPASSVLTMERFSEFFTALSDHIPSCHGDQVLSQLMLAIVDSDSTSVFYNLSDGIRISSSVEIIKKTDI